MYFLLALLPVLLLALASARLFRRALWQTLPVALSFVVLVVYLSGLCGSLTVGRITIILLGVVSLLYLFLSLARDTAARRKPALRFTTDLVIVLVGAVLIVLGILRGEAAIVTARIHNTGNAPLAVHEIEVSCDCTTVEYKKRMVSPGAAFEMEITYNAEDRGFFDRIIYIYANTESSPITIRLEGEVV